MRNNKNFRILTMKKSKLLSLIENILCEGSISPMDIKKIQSYKIIIPKDMPTDYGFKEWEKEFKGVRGLISIEDISYGDILSGGMKGQIPIFNDDGKFSRRFKKTGAIVAFFKSKKYRDDVWFHFQSILYPLSLLDVKHPQPGPDLRDRNVIMI